MSDGALDFSKVLFTTHAGEVGGAELCLVDIIEGLAGAHVLLFSDGPFREMLERRGVSIDILEAGSVLRLRRRATIFDALAKLPDLMRVIYGLRRRMRDYGLIYANSMKAFVVSAIASIGRSRPLLWHLHDILDDEFGSAMKSAAIRLANARADLVIVNSLATERAFRKAGGTARTKLIYNGIDAAPFAPLDESENGIRDFDDGRRRVGLFGRLAPWKGQHFALHAISKLPDHSLMLVGGALFGEADYEAKLRLLASDLDILDRVEFLGHRDDVPALMRSCDVVLHTSVAPEPFGRVIVEGMLAERPVIATAHGGALEIIENGVDGLLVAPADAEAIERALASLAAEPAMANRLARCGRAKALTQFTLASSQAQILEMLVEFAGAQSISG